MRRRRAPVGVGEFDGTVAQVVHGFRTARATPFVVPLFLVVAMVEFTYGAQTVQLVVYSERVLGLGAGGYGALLAAAGVGGLLSAIVNGRLAMSSRVSVIVVTAGALVCATQLAYASVDGLVVALGVTVVGGAGLVACEVVAETALARIVPADVLGRVMGVFAALSVAVMIAGAVLAPVLIAATSLHTSLVVLGLATLLVTVLCLPALGGLDVLTRQRAEALASRVAVLEQLPITAGVPRLVLEQLASESQLCPLPPGVDVIVQGAPAHAFYAVVEGRVLVHRDAEKVASLGPGEHFGERGLLDNAPRNATVTTETDSTILRLEGERADRGAAICRDIAECARSLERVTAGCVAGRTHRTGRRPDVGGSVMIRDATVLVIGAGYPGKRRAYERMAELGAQVVVVDEPGHWSEALVTDGVAASVAPRAHQRRRRRRCRRDAGRGGTVRRPTRWRPHHLGEQRERGGACRVRTGAAREPAGGGGRRPQQGPYP